MESVAELNVLCGDENNVDVNEEASFKRMVVNADLYANIVGY